MTKWIAFGLALTTMLALMPSATAGDKLAGPGEVGVCVALYCAHTTDDDNVVQTCGVGNIIIQVGTGNDARFCTNQTAEP